MKYNFLVLVFYIFACIVRRIKLNKYLKGYFFLLDNFSVKYLKLGFACVKLKKKGKYWEIINIFTTMCLFYGHVGRTVVRV